MSDYSAISGVSNTLRTLLLDRMEFAANTLAVTISTPFVEANQGFYRDNGVALGDRVGFQLK